MKKALSIILILLALVAPAQTIVKTFTVGSKKINITDFDLHYHAGIAISGWASSSFYYITKRQVLSSFLGACVGTAAGIAKEEIWDRQMHRGTPSFKDKAATWAGSFFVMLPFNIIIAEHRKKKEANQAKAFSDPLQY